MRDSGVKNFQLICTPFLLKKPNIFIGTIFFNCDKLKTLYHTDMAMIFNDIHIYNLKLFALHLFVLELGAVWVINKRSTSFRENVREISLSSKGLLR